MSQNLCSQLHYQTILIQLPSSIESYLPQALLEGDQVRHDVFRTELVPPGAEMEPSPWYKRVATASQ